MPLDKKRINKFLALLFQELLNVLSGRISERLEAEIRVLTENYAGNITSVMCQFPAQQIADVVDKFSASILHKDERTAFFDNVQPLMQLVQR